MNIQAIVEHLRAAIESDIMKREKLIIYIQEVIAECEHQGTDPSLTEIKKILAALTSTRL